MAALLMAMRRTTTSPLFTKLINPNRNRSAISGRPFASIIDSSEANCTINAHGGSFTRSDEFPIHRGTCDQYMENPFQVSGPSGSYAAKRVEEGLFVRMEMAGIEKEDVKLLVEYDSVLIKGEGRKESKYEDTGRTYNASIELCSNSFQPEKIKAELKNGVLRMLIPKANNFEVTSGLYEIKIE